MAQDRNAETIVWIGLLLLFSWAIGEDHGALKGFQTFFGILIGYDYTQIILSHIR